MKKLILFLLFAYTLFGCTICSIYAPNVHITTNVTAEKNATLFNIEWKFDKKFVDTLVIYDENLNNVFDIEEQKLIKGSLLDYLSDKQFLTYIAYQHKDQDPLESYLSDIKNPKIDFLINSEEMIFSYEFQLDFVLEKEHKLLISFVDDGKNFNLIPIDTIVKNYHKTKIIGLEQNQVIVYLYNPVSSSLKNEENESSKIVMEEEVIEQNSTSYLDLMSKKLAFYKAKIETLLTDIKENNSIISYLWLILFSFFYGVLHALGPGHGKSLVGAYFLSENRSISKAASISTMIGLVHTFSAFTMTFVVYYFFSVMFSNFFLDVENVASKVSAIIIIAIAVYMIYRKFEKNKKHEENNTSCGCGGCQSKGTDIGVIISAGIVPCPGTVTIFLFTFGLGIVFVGFLSAIVMSIGMSLVIFITAYLSSKVRKTTSSNKNIVKVFEYGSLFFLLGLGIILLIV